MIAIECIEWNAHCNRINYTHFGEFIQQLQWKKKCFKPEWLPCSRLSNRTDQNSKYEVQATKCLLCIYNARATSCIYISLSATFLYNICDMYCVAMICVTVDSQASYTSSIGFLLLWPSFLQCSPCTYTHIQTAHISTGAALRLKIVVEKIQCDLFVFQFI